MKIFLIFMLICIYGVLSQLAMIGLKYKNPFYKFKLTTDDYDGTKNVIFRGPDDKFAYFWISLFWLPIVVLYFIPIGIFKIIKFVINAIAWSIVKIFKL